MHFEDQAQAQDAYAQLEARATTASVRTQPGAESLSYSVLTDEATDTVVTQWHTDTFGIVRSGPEEAFDVAPDWIDPLGDSTKAYPATDVFGVQTRVRHSGVYWLNTHGNANVWEPGGTGIGETIWQQDGAVE